MESLPLVLIHFIWIIPLIFLIVYVGSPRFRGTMGESQVRRILSSMLSKKHYTVFNNVILPAGGGSVQIDHLVVSQFGIIVIETVHRKGSISGSEVQERWKHYRFGRFARFDNPLQINYSAGLALEQLLQLPGSHIHSIVVFAGISGFKTKLPGNVVRTEALIPLIRKFNKKLLLQDTANQALIKIKEARLNSDHSRLPDMWSLLRLGLVIALLSASWFAFRSDLKKISTGLLEQIDKNSAPEKYHADGSMKSQSELWEDSLICAYSLDSDRCSCYEPEGKKVDLGSAQCQELAERGSVLKQ